MGIINEYEEILIGNRKKISSNYFLFDKKGNERVALSVIRYAIENLLGWDVHNAIKLFNSNYISFMKLDQMVKYIVFPSTLFIAVAWCSAGIIKSWGKSIEVFGIKFFLNGLKSFPKSLEMNNFSGTQEFDGIRNLRYISDYSENIVISRTAFCSGATS